MKTVKGVLKRILAVVFILAVVLGSLKIISKAIVDDSGTYTRVMMHEFYNQDNIDLLFVGASHCYRSVDPALISERTGKKAFCASSSGQFIDVSLAMVKEAADLYDLDHVYLELSASIAAETGWFRERDGLTQLYIVSDYMRPSKNKLELLLNATSPEHYLDTFLLPHSGLEYVFNPAGMMDVYRIKRTKAYRNYGYDYLVHEHEWYVGDGYVRHNKVMQDSMFFSVNCYEPYDISLITDDWRNTVLEIADFCRERGIPLSFYCAPVSDYQLAAWGNYDDYTAVVQELADEAGVDFVDFNRLDEDHFERQTAYFFNADHLNMYGSHLFSENLAAYINGELPADAFGERVSDRLDAKEPIYYGVALQMKSFPATSDFRLVSNHPGALEYRVELEPARGEPALLQDFDVNDHLSAEFEIGDKLIVAYRRAGDTDAEPAKLEYIIS